ncbi:hypothetical protein BJ912DRAFT_558430 [Pholiota molesta]|nr:hypothetical protein BJ912DRAFT_558430 [Pholiota molesta]
MDPFSISLGVITIVTALRDIIETVQVIRDSLSKRPQNYRNAQKLADEVLKTLYGIEEIYQEHKQTFDKSKSLKKAITDLQIEMRSVYEQCARLIPPVSERKRDKYKMAFYSFWNREKVENLLLELRVHVDRCSHDFHLLSGFRTEAHVLEIREAIVQSTSQGFSGSYSHSGLGTTTNMTSNVLRHVSNSQIIAFTQSTSMSITWIPDSVPTRDLSDAYLRRVLGSVHHSLRSILTCWSQNLPTNMELSNPEITWNLEELPVSKNIVHENAVAEALHFQFLLRDNPSNSCFDRVDGAIIELTNELDDLDMHEDAVVLAALRVDLWRVIVKQHPSQTSSLGLVHALHMLVYLNAWSMGNRRQAYSRSEEAIKILQSLSTAPAILPLKKYDMMLMPMLMLEQAWNEPHYVESFQ